MIVLVLASLIGLGILIGEVILAGKGGYFKR